MISVDSHEIEKDLLQINKLLNEYELTYQTLFKELSSSSFFWNDGYSTRFIEAMPREREKNKSYFTSLNEVKDIYTYILNQYKVIGKKIKVNEEYRGSLLEKMNNLMSELSTIISSYNRLDTSFCPSEATVINNHKKRLTKLYDRMNEEKIKLKDLFDKLEKIENQVNTNLSKIMLDRIEEFEIAPYLEVGVD